MKITRLISPWIVLLSLAVPALRPGHGNDLETAGRGRVTVRLGVDLPVGRVRATGPTLLISGAGAVPSRAARRAERSEPRSGVP